MQFWSPLTNIWIDMTLKGNTLHLQRQIFTRSFCFRLNRSGRARGSSLKCQPVVGDQACNVRTLEAETGISGVQGQLQLHRERPAWSTWDRPGGHSRFTSYWESSAKTWKSEDREYGRYFQNHALPSKGSMGIWFRESRQIQPWDQVKRSLLSILSWKSYFFFKKKRFVYF